MDSEEADIETILRAGLSGKTVLYLEDEMACFIPVSEMLNRLGVDMVQHVQRGEIALREGTARRFDVLLLDRNNPGLDGLDALMAIRASGLGSHQSPALIVTGKMNSEMQRSLGLLSGADDYVDKSVGPMEILTRIVKCLSRAQPGPAAPGAAPAGPREVRNGSLVLRKYDRTAYCAGELLELGAQAFDMLLAMAEAPGQPFTKAMLYEVASPHWRGSSLPDGFEHAVHKAINRLREALEPGERKLPEPLRPLIVTLRGQGYLLRDMRGL